MSEDPQKPKPILVNSPDPKVSIISVACRICYDNEKEEELINPCRCKGTVAFVHRSCLETWLGESNTTTCELCHQEFKTERTPRYTSRESICRWCFTNSSGGHGVRSDIIACTLITPLAIVITYVCLFSSEYYNQRKFSSLPAARWTSVSLLVMIGIMLVGYYMWVYSVIRMHARLWYNWWQRTCEVRYIPPSSINIRAGTPSTVLTAHPNTPIANLHEDGTTSNEEENESVSGEKNTRPQAKRSDHVVLVIRDSSEASISYESIV